MIHYYALFDGDNRQGPYSSSRAACQFLKQISRNRRHSDEEANYFFLHQSVVEQVEVLINGVEVDRFNLGWVAREKSGRQELALDAVR